MRPLGVTEHWDKLKQPKWTTFRVPRKDKDWQVGEQVQVVYKPRSKQRESLGVAEIISKESKTFIAVEEADAIADGFESCLDMWMWLKEAHKGIKMTAPINKLTLRWADIAHLTTEQNFKEEYNNESY